MTLRTDPNFTDPDGAYEALVAAHEGLSREESEALNARLVLILGNHVGDAAFRAALEVARVKEA